MILCNDGGFALTGRTFSFMSGFGYNAYVIKTDPQGNADCHLKPFTTLANSYLLSVPGVMSSLSSSLTSSNSTFIETPFSNSGIICNSVPLPVEIISLIGKVAENKNVLTWTTASEINNDFFALQRSHNGKDFKIIGTVKGAGNSTQTLIYSFTDNYPLSENYYRLSKKIITVIPLFQK